jgi:hypothetical protein
VVIAGTSNFRLTKRVQQIAVTSLSRAMVLLPALAKRWQADSEPRRSFGAGQDHMPITHALPAKMISSSA